MSNDLTEPLNSNFSVEEGKIPTDSDKHEDSEDSWEKWSFYRTLAYWISIMYLEGSTLFVIGAFFSMLDMHSYSEKNEKALVSIPYFVGSIAFTLGGYFGIVEIINIPNVKDGDQHLGTKYALFFTGRKQYEAMKASGVTFDAMAGYSSYALGAVLFNINTIVSFFPEKMTVIEADIFSYAMAVAGSLLFVVGGCFDCKVNQVFTAPNPKKTGQWLAGFNLIGGIFFSIAAIAAATQVMDADETRWYEAFTYLVGSAAFAAGSFCSLFMWKDEQYGLGLVPTLNNQKARPGHDSRLKNLEQYGCGKSSAMQLPWLWLYIINSSASVMEIAAVWESSKVSKDGYDGTGKTKIIKSLLNVALSHGILFLGSIIHHVPTAQPHNWLLRYMRFVLVLFTAATIISVVNELDDSPQD